MTLFLAIGIIFHPVEETSLLPANLRPKIAQIRGNVLNSTSSKYGSLESIILTKKSLYRILQDKMFRYVLFSFSQGLFAVTITVTTNADTPGGGSFREALTNAVGGDTITFDIGSSTITLGSDLPVIAVTPLTIDVASGTPVIDGVDLYRVFAIGSNTTDPVVSISGITIQNAAAIGGLGGPTFEGSGGGGGLGAGGAAFVKGNVTISSTTVTGCSAIGGDGGTVSNIGVRRGGGGGAGASFSSAAKNGGTAPLTDIGGAGGGDNAGAGGASGVPPANNGANATGLSGGAGGGGRGVGAKAGTGGTGGYGGGGGGAGNANSPNPGGDGGNGGFGGGGGGAGDLDAPGTLPGGTGGLFAGNGGDSTYVSGVGLSGAGGGGGGGVGGSFFVYNGATLTIAGSSSIADGSVAGGDGGTTVAVEAENGSPGTGFASGIFLGDGSFLVFDGAPTISCPIDTHSSLTDGGVTKQGAGTVTLSNTNSYKGGTTITGGNLSIFTDTNLGDTSTSVTLNGGTLEAAASISSSRAFSLGSSNGTIQVDPTFTYTASGQFTGLGSLTKTGTGTLVLSNSSNNYSGGTTTISAGTLSVTNNGNLGDAANTVTLNGGTLEAAATLSSSRGFSLSSTGTIQVNPTFTFTASGQFTSTGSLTKTGTGTLLMSNTGNDYSGATNVSAGTLNLTGSLLNSTVNMSGGSLSVTGSGTHTIGGLEGSSGVSIASSNTLSIGNNDAPTAYSGTITSSGAVTKVGSGTLTLSGTSDYTGATTISAGTIALTGNITNSTVTVQASGTLAVSGAGTHNVGNLVPVGSVTIAAGSILSAGANNTSTAASGIISGDGAFTKVGISSLGLGGASTYFGNTTISSGTLSLSGSLENSTVNMTGGTLAVLGSGTHTVGGLQGSSGVSIAASNTLAVGNNDATTADYSGIISGSGALSKIGTGTTTFSGDNTYFGDTTISAGTLSLTGSIENSTVDMSGGTLAVSGAGTHTTGGITGSSSITIASSSILAVGNNDSSPAAYSGNIQGDGALTKVGTGTTTLSSSNDYNGNTTISAGTLTLSGNIINSTVSVSGGTFAVTGAGVHNIGGLSGTTATTIAASSILAIGNNNAPTSYSGAISGDGTLTKVGTNTSILTGANSYPTTNVTTGTLQGDSTSLQGNITNDATLVFNQTSNGTFSGTIGGTGDFVKQGAATLGISGITVTQNSATIAAGSLQLNGTIHAPTTISPGATLFGNGLVEGTLMNQGTLNPGNSPGTFLVFGDYLQATGSTLEVEITPTDSDLLNVSDSITIESGATLSLLPDFGTYSLNQLYTIATAGVGINGTFSTVTTSLPTLDLEVFYLPVGDPKNIVLAVNLSPFSPIIPGGNNAQVAQCIDSLDAPEGSDAENQIDELRFLTLPNLLDALSQLHPGIFTGLFLQQQSSSLQVQSSISLRLEEWLRREKSFQKGKDVWLDLSYGITKQSTLSLQQIGFDSFDRAVVLGCDMSQNAHHRVGFSASYSQNHLHWRNSRGRSSTQAVSASFYGGYKAQFGYVHWILSGFADFFDVTRKITFHGIYSTQVRRAKSSPFGFGSDLQFELGTFFRKKGWSFNPFIRADYLYCYRNSFQERGAITWNLKVQSTDADLFKPEVGAIFSYLLFDKDNAKVQLFASCKEAWEIRNFGKEERGSFQNSSCVMNVTGLYPNRSLFSTGAGLQAHLGENLSFLANYESSWAIHEFNQRGNLELSIRF